MTRRLTMRISRAFEQCAEFLERQMAFDFGRIARVVIPIIVRLRDKMRAWERVKPKYTGPTWTQLPLTAPHTFST